MIEHLVAALRGAGTDPDWRDIADALWLADLRHTDAPTGPAPQRLVQQGHIPVHPSASVPIRTDDGPTAPDDDQLPQGHPRLEYSDAADGTPLRAAADPRRALPAQLGIGRAFRRLARTRLSLVATVLNVEATVARYCDTGVLVPVTVPAREGWFHEVILIVDAGPTMAVWQPTVSALASVLAHHRAFRAVHRWALTGDRSSVQVRSGAGLTFDPAEIADPQRRQLILVVTDCVGDLWRGSAVWQALEKWGERLPVTLVQVLPRRLWPATAMGDADTLVSGVTRGTPNGRLSIQQPWWWDDPRPPRRALPVTTLEPSRLDQWARMLMSADHTPSAGLLLSRSVEESRPASAEQRVNFFRTTASDHAVRLATLLSAVEVTLPVLHLVAQRLVPGATVAHLAEVLISGLLQTDGEDTRYEFRPGVRVILREALTTDDTLDVWRTVAPFLEAATGRQAPFMNLLSNQPPDPALPGELTELAQDLISRLGLTLPPPAPPDPTRFRWSFVAGADSMRELRRRLRAWFTALDLDKESATNMLTAASEAAANAVEHAYRDRPAGDVEVTGTVTLTDVELTVRDHGSWTSHEPGPSRNRGFFLIREITDEMVIERENGTTVYMRLARPQPSVEELLAEATVAVITTLTVERHAINQIFGGMTAVKAGRSGNHYQIGRFPSRDPNRPHVIVAAQPPTVGTFAVTATVRGLTRDFPLVKLIVSCGLASGASDVNPGDIVVATNLVQEYHRREGEPGLSRSKPSLPMFAAESALRRRNADDTVMKALARRMRDKWQMPYPTDNGAGTQDHPRLHRGPIVDTGVLFRDLSHFDEVMTRHGAKAAAMEGSGIVAATETAGLEWFAIKGIADQPTGSKDDSWQAYAALAAASYLRMVLVACTPYPIERSSTPSRPSTADLGEMLDALLQISELSSPVARQQLIGLLRPALATTIAESATPRLAMLAILRACVDFPGGLAELADTLSQVVEPSPATRHAVTLLRERER
ncbi:ATP-binding protein [Micromonospora sp. ANENR4]|uniref:SAV_2336 N-terminal domain-related protein n=1 Tax=Micromonospora sp. ANENR4 TaxID=2783662 RepID=UPI00188DE2C9|nr:SAV_2336 N-terminal domain-related protein [Micromonospora sp. ANENR4]MBF5033045.1 ATP-binding protein [Micromonospora sp. ANENR4]